MAAVEGEVAEAGCIGPVCACASIGRLVRLPHNGGHLYGETTLFAGALLGSPFSSYTCAPAAAFTTKLSSG
jgi:hypothetical protein